MIGAGESIVLILSSIYVLFRFLSFYLALSVVVIVLIAIASYIKWKQTYWKNLGVAGPSPLFFLGNFHTMIIKGFREVQIDWHEKYGPVVGIYGFIIPQLMISDLDLLKQILVKDFPYFMNRNKSPLIGKKSKSIMASMLSVLEDQRWKDVRNTITPSFTSGKMKQMVGLMNHCVRTLGDILGEKAEIGEAFEAKRICSNFTMDVIAVTAFATNIDVQHDENSPFVKYANQLFQFKLTDIRMMLMIGFPNVLRKLDELFGIRVFFNEGEEFFRKSLGTILAERQKRPKEKPDFLQLLLNSSESKEEETEHDEAITHSNLGGRKVILTDEEIMGQCFIFMVAGYETTASTLHLCMYCLATHPEIQDKCVEEIERALQDQEVATYDHVQKHTPYLEAVMMETLRMFPPAVITARRATEDYHLDGLLIKKDMEVFIPIHYIHYNPEYYATPEKFMPERFLPEERATRDPITFLPFGYGPRNCIGMRFAQMEIKLALAYLLAKFRFVPSDKTEPFPPKMSNQGLAQPVKPLVLKVEHRE